MSVCGSVWLDDMCRLRDVVGKEPISETFRFGDGRAVMSSERYTIPIVLGNLALRIPVCIVPGELCLLLGRDWMGRHSPAICYKNRELRVGGTKAPLVGSCNGHPTVSINPEGYAAMTAASGTREEVPRARKPRDSGPAKPWGRLFPKLAKMIFVVNAVGALRQMCSAPTLGTCTSCSAPTCPRCS